MLFDFMIIKTDPTVYGRTCQIGYVFIYLVLQVFPNAMAADLSTMSHQVCRLWEGFQISGFATHRAILRQRTISEKAVLCAQAAEVGDWVQYCHLGEAG
jgi:hypothetical protein